MALARMHAGVMAYVDALRPLLGTFGVFDLPAAAASAELLRVLVEPTAEEAERLGDIEHGEGVGSLAARPLASFRGVHPAPAALLDHYRGTFWRPGLLARHEPHALLLRTALWLREQGGAA